MTTFNEWFNTFLAEKDLAFQSWEFKTKDNTHLIDSDVVIEAIHNAPAHEQKGIQKIIVKIDFYNGDVNRYFQHLAGVLVAQY